MGILEKVLAGLKETIREMQGLGNQHPWARRGKSSKSLPGPVRTAVWRGLPDPSWCLCQRDAATLHCPGQHPGASVSQLHSSPSLWSPTDVSYWPHL